MLNPDEKVDWISKAREMVNDSADEAMIYLNSQLAVKGYVMKANIIVCIEFEPVAPPESDRLFAKSMGIEL